MSFLQIVTANRKQIPKIYGFKVHCKNFSGRPQDGTAIAVKHSLPHKIYDDFISDLLAIEIDTNTGPIILSTIYQPPTRQYIPTPDFIKLFRQNTPVYMIADLNANHPTLGYRSTNIKGKTIHHLIRQRTINHIGPNFPTYYSHNSATTPDIILTNFRTYHNFHVTQGPLTNSDNIPVILTVSASPIQTPIPPRPSFTQANWEGF